MDSILFWLKMGDILPRPINKVTTSLALFAHNYELTYDRKIENYGDFKKTSKVSIKRGDLFVN